VSSISLDLRAIWRCCAICS